MKLVQRKLLSVWVVCSLLFASPVMALTGENDSQIVDAMAETLGTAALWIAGSLGVALLVVGFGFIWGIITGMEYQNGYRQFKSRGRR